MGAEPDLPMGCSWRIGRISWQADKPHTLTRTK